MEKRWFLSDEDAEFLDKIVQLPFAIPRMSEIQKEEFVMLRMRAAGDGQSCPEPPKVASSEEEFRPKRCFGLTGESKMTTSKNRGAIFWSFLNSVFCHKLLADHVFVDH